ncbi:MAG TPA: DUF2269 family protein [Acidimicrobiia bacterium]|nr:DUF2269 family protein [Acidimicrobiia bacterium]
MAPYWRLVHIVAAIALLSGLLGRWICLRRAVRSGRIDPVVSLVEAADVFDRVVRPSSLIVLVAGLGTMWTQNRPLTGEGSWWLLTSLILYLSILPIVPLVFVRRGKIFAEALAESQRRGEITPELMSAFTDRTVAVARTYEAGAIGVIVLLMILKPF